MVSESKMVSEFDSVSVQACGGKCATKARRRQPPQQPRKSGMPQTNMPQTDMLQVMGR